MATGDTNDILNRIKSTLPSGWFGDVNPILTALLTGLASALSFIYSLYAYAKLQTRIATATDGWLDMISADFFGTALPRKPGQTDTSFRALIQINLLREKGTRRAMRLAIEQLTGRTPILIEPARPADTGGYGIACGYGVAGRYGSMLIPYQAFVIAYRPSTSGIPYISGYGISTGGYSTPSRAAYGSMSMIVGAIADQDIYDAIEAVKPIGTTIWTRLET